MKVGGFVKNSFVDYPGLIATSIFVVGCNMKCWYCHNKHLLNDNQKLVSEKEIFEFLSSRKGFIDAVVVSGGEPTLQSDLKEFLAKVKGLGYKVKLDTNGTNFEVLKDIIESNLVDYVAMDIKAPIEKYSEFVCSGNAIKNVQMCISYLIESKIEYEFRTTFSSDLDVEDIKKICDLIVGAKNYSLQKCRTEFFEKSFLSEDMKKKMSLKEHSKKDFEECLQYAKNKIKNTVIKGF